jgi:integrase
MFRHTLATSLQASGAGVKVTQELLRHSSPVMTLGTYAQAVTEDKRDAQDTIAALFFKASPGDVGGVVSALMDPYWTHRRL